MELETFQTQKYTDPDTGITWEGTGEVIDRVSIYDWEEIVDGEDQEGNEYRASASVSIGMIVEIHEPEKIA